MAEKAIRRAEKALSPRFVETVSDPEKYFDGHGLFLRVTKNGATQWLQRINIRGKRRDLGLGSPPAVPLAIACKMALANRGNAMTGGDPLAEKRAARKALPSRNPLTPTSTRSLTNSAIPSTDSYGGTS